MPSTKKAASDDKVSNQDEKSSNKTKKKEPGTKGQGEYFRIIVRPKKLFTTFRYHDVGKPGGLLRLAGKRKSGSWADHAWLIDKGMAHLENKSLIADSPDARELLDTIGHITHLKGDVFERSHKENTTTKRKG